MRQGCPLSPCSYVLVAEVLACDIRSSALISGLTLPGSPSSLLLFLLFLLFLLSLMFILCMTGGRELN